MADRPAAKKGSRDSKGHFVKKEEVKFSPEVNEPPGMDTSVDMSKEEKVEEMKKDVEKTFKEVDEVGEDINTEKLDAILDACKTMVKEFGLLKEEMMRKRKAGNF